MLSAHETGIPAVEMHAETHAERSSCPEYKSGESLTIRGRLDMFSGILLYGTFPDQKLCISRTAGVHIRTCSAFAVKKYPPL